MSSNKSFSISAVVIFAGLLVLAVGCEAEPEHLARVTSSSMEPTFHGPQFSTFCQSCNEIHRFSASPQICPWYGSILDPAEQTDGELIALKKIDASHPLRRGELVVFQNDSTERWELKRLVGFPNEHIAIIDGDIWVDGDRWQKSFSQWRQSAIVVDRWRDVEASSETLKLPIAFLSNSLWPRSLPNFNTNVIPHPSPILDEYHCQPDESRELVPVSDIGLEIEFHQQHSLSRGPTTICLELYRGGEVQSNDFVRLYRHVLKIQPRTNQICMTWCDGQWLVDGAEFVETTVQRGGESSSTTQCSAINPIRIVSITPNRRIESATIYRDIHFRNVDTLDGNWKTGDGYFVLGDNVAVSVDSRQIGTIDRPSFVATRP